MIITRERFVTPSGLAATILREETGRAPHRDAERHWLTVTSESVEARMYVDLLTPRLLDLALQQHEGLLQFENVREVIVLLAVISHLGTLGDLPTDNHGNRVLRITPSDAIQLLKGAPLDDRSIRRFLARRLYDHYTRSDLNTWELIDEFDVATCGSTVSDVLRNARLLEAEGYIRIGLDAPNGFEAMPTARLVREVEKFGAAQEDSVNERDYLGALAAYTSLSPHREALTLEYGRYVTATSTTELESVFRAVAPVVEAIVKETLRANGSRRHHSSLGPAISDLKNRGVGGPGLWMQLDHVLSFPRDLTEHGLPLPVSVLRIACANAFELVPQLASLQPR